jgi:hypothetical protein
MSMHAEKRLLTEVTGIFAVPNHAADDVPAQSLEAVDQALERAGSLPQHVGDQFAVVFEDGGSARIHSTKGYDLHATGCTALPHRQLCNRRRGARIHSRNADFHRLLPETTAVMHPEIIVLPTLFAAVVLSIKTIADARTRARFLESNAQESLIRSILEGEERRRRQSALRWGIVLVFLAAGFVAAEFLDWERPTPGVIAVLLGATGLGNIVSYIVCRKIDDSAVGGRASD